MSSFNCTFVPESCPSPSVCFPVYNSSTTEIVGSYCDCLNYYDFTGYPTCTTPTPATIALFCFYVFILTAIFLTFSYQSWRFFKYCKREVLNKFKWAKVLNLSFLSAMCAFFSSLLIFIFSILQVVGISSPDKVSVGKNGVRLSYMHGVRNFIVGAGLVLVSLILILQTGAFAEISYYSSKMRPMRTLKRVYFLTSILTSCVFIIAFTLIGAGTLLALNCFLEAVSALFVAGFLWGAHWMIQELRRGPSEFGNMITILKRTRLVLSLGTVSELIGTAINIAIPNPGHGEDWGAIAPCFLLFGVAVMSLSLFSYGNNVLENRMNKKTSSESKSARNLSVRGGITNTAVAQSLTDGT